MNYLGATLTWEGRTLTSYEDETNIIEYEYDENGMRYRTTVTSKTDGLTGSYEYVWVDGKLISIVYVSGDSTETAKYLYNDRDGPVGMVLTDADGTLSTYYYLKNLQGDITHIVSAGGKLLVEFTYDVFGKQTVHYQANGSTIIGMIELVEQVMVCALNPFGYRGYCYDTYTGLYYLQSRYYDPDTGRFINADDTNYLNATGTVLGCNLFAYCENDPVNRVDPRGSVSKKLKNVIRTTGLPLEIYRKFLCVRLYCWGFVNRKKSQTYDFSNSWGSLIKTRISNSVTIKNFVSKKIKYMKNNNISSKTFNCNLSFYSNISRSVSDLDLTLAIGSGGNFTIKIKKTNKKDRLNRYYYDVTVTLSKEKFDFEHWKIVIGNKTYGDVDPHSSSQIVTLINNIGYFTQAYGAFVDFTWGFTVTYRTR